MCLRAAKEGSRNILLVSSRSNAIQIRDANDGLLLRMLSHDLTGVSIYDMLIEGSTIYCGSNKSEIFSVDFTVSIFQKKIVDNLNGLFLSVTLSIVSFKVYAFNFHIFRVLDGCCNKIASLWRWDNLR